MNKGRCIPYSVLPVLVSLALVAVSCQPAASPTVTPAPVGPANPAPVAAPTSPSPIAAPTKPPPPTRSPGAVAAPDFSLPTTDGQTIKLSDLQGRPVMINFWATWCPPCRDEMPLLQGVYEEKMPEGLVLLAVDIGETSEQVKKFARDNKLTFTFVLDLDKSVAATYGIRAIPTTILVDKNGDIRDVKVGAYTNKAEIRNALKKIM
ncbi:MAG: TlpA family protein disulfide reductase [Chloroflexi bacterium]|nr:TlpA family protein disulfide reductase [Chloroflexota bacterium]